MSVDGLKNWHNGLPVSNLDALPNLGADPKTIKYWFRGLPVQPLSPTAPNMIQGVSVFGRAGIVAGTIPQGIQGVSATCSVGGMDQGTIVGVQAVCSVGHIDGKPAVYGVSATGQVGSFAVHIDTNIPLEGVSAQGFIGGIAGPTPVPSRMAYWYNGLPIPNLASANDFGTAQFWYAGLPGQPINVAFGGSPSINDSADLVGVEATGAVGLFSQETFTPVDVLGVQATAQPGTFGSVVTKEITGTLVLGLVGTITGQNPQGVTGVAATGQVGSLAGNVGAVFSGVQATGHVGAMNQAWQAPLTGTVAVGSAGTIHSDILFFGITGVQATAHVGVIPESVGGVGGSAEAIGGVGTIGIDIRYDVLLQGVVCHAGVATPLGAEPMQGVFATGQTGLMRGGPGANLYSVPVVSTAGVFTFDLIKGIPGASAQGHAGSIQGGVPQGLVGVAAQGQVGTFAKDARKTLTGVQAVGIAQAFTNVFLRGNAATGFVGTFLNKLVVKTINGVQASALLGAVVPNLVTPSKYYLTSQSNFGSLVLNVIPPVATHATGWRVAREAAPEFGIMKYNTEQNFNVFGGVTQLGAAPTAINGNSWRTFGTISGTVEPGTWTMQVAVRAVDNASGQRGRIRLRVWKSANSNGTGAVEITSGAQVGTTTGAITTAADQLSVVTFTTAAPVTLNAEYLFFEVEWEITTAATNNQADLRFRLGDQSFVVVPVMSITPTMAGASATGSAGLIRVEETKGIVGVSATCSAGSMTAGRTATLEGVFCVVDHGVFDFAESKVVPGVQAVGRAGTAHSQIALIGSISLVGANADCFAGDITIPFDIPMSGNEMVGHAGDISAEIDSTFNGVEATCGVGDITSNKSLDLALEGVEATCEPGLIDGGVSVTFDGVSAFVITGNMSPETRILIQGVFAQCFAGPIAKQPDMSVDMPGTFCTGHVGTFAVDEQVTIEGVQATAQPGELPIELTSLLEGVSTEGQLGVLNPSVDFFWQGVECTGYVARLHPNSAIMDGAECRGEVGIIEGRGRSRGGSDRLLPRRVGNVLWYDQPPRR